MDHPTCSSCAFYYDLGGMESSSCAFYYDLGGMERGVCRRYPPVIAGEEFEELAAFPAVLTFCWCGEHSALAERQGVSSGPAVMGFRDQADISGLGPAQFDISASTRIASALKYLDTCEELWGLEGEGEVPRWRRVFLAELRRRLTS